MESFKAVIELGAPYADRIEGDGRVLIYEGHDVPRTKAGPDPKSTDQPYRTPSGHLTQNGLFLKAVNDYKNGRGELEPVRVYEKIRAGIWSFNGTFKLVDAWEELSDGRKVFRFKLEPSEGSSSRRRGQPRDLPHDRLIPTTVKLEVWKRDKGRCVVCRRQDNLHFDHIIPFSKGGSSITPQNIQLLCARHNLGKRNKIQ